jgi:hypothetical protein
MRKETAMKASVELKNLYLRLLEAYNTGDESFMADHTARQEGMLIIGTDPDEWWDTPEVFLEALREDLKQFRDIGVRVEPGNPQAFEEGTIGWLADRPVFYLPDGTVLESRVTAVLRYQEDQWKFVQQHFSYAVLNEDLVDVNEFNDNLLSNEAGA